MKKIKLILYATLLFFVASCKKDYSSKQEQTNKKEVDLAKVFKTPSTHEEKLLVENLGKVTEILKELYKDKSNLKVVNAAIYSKAYTDESVLLKDLIYLVDSRLSKVDRFKALSGKWNVSLNKFADNFWGQVNKKNDPSFKQFLDGLNSTTANSVATAQGDQVSIYFPYSEQFLPTGGGTYEPITSIATATADADEGWGSQPYYVNGILQNYVQVLVNDEYAEIYPLHIVGVNGVEPYNVPSIQNVAFPPGPPIDLPNLPREVKQVYIGDVRCKHQYDKFISFTGNGGGSEIKFTRADGFLKVLDGQVQADVVVPVDQPSISRYNIRHEYFVDYSIEWDGDWEGSNFQQNLAIYEDDNRNSSTFSATVTTTLTWPPAGGQPGVIVTAPIGFTISFKSDDAIIRQTNYNRDVFFILNRTNLEGEMKNDWPVRDKNGNVSFTLNDRTYF